MKKAQGKGGMRDYDESEDSHGEFLEQWALIGGDIYLGVGKTVKILPAGMYAIEQTDRGITFNKRKISVDDLIYFPDSLTDVVLQEINSFWGSADKFYNYGFLHRRGYMFYGPPGSGKSCIVQQIIQGVLKNNGVVFLCHTHPLTIDRALIQYRTIEPNRNIVCVYEDIDAIISDYDESQLLSLLDGESQIDHVLNIATTNYPENLDRRIIARPRRFDRIIKVDMPTAEQRKLYFEKKLNINKKDIDKWVNDTKNFSFAALADLVISVECLGKSFDESLRTLKEIMDGKFSSEEFKDSSAGFQTIQPQ
jgi:SpoVK/Ycf46/Vps4 family AAA+-type ATPase